MAVLAGRVPGRGTLKTQMPMPWTNEPYARTRTAHHSPD
jgi:hypothetical protein